MRPASGARVSRLLAAAQGASPELITASLSSNGKFIHIHLVGGPNQVVTLQLELRVATRFYENLATLLDPAKGKETPQPRWH